ncbi:MAG: permease, partial [Clostridia bacterium]|nr:permease [Clostridia bacterium]
NTGTIGTADKAVVMWSDYINLKNNGITIADTESAGVEWVCKKNDIKCLIVKGISDFPQNEDYQKDKNGNEEQIN